MSCEKLLKLLGFRQDDDRKNWRLQNVSKKSLYDYINVRGTGRLVDVFSNNSDSPAKQTKALNTIIRRDIAAFLYCGGNGKVVSSKRNAFAPQSNVSLSKSLW